MIFALVQAALFAYVSAAAFNKGTEATEENIEGLADLGDPKVYSQLECSACKCVVRDVKGELMKLNALRHGKQKSYEVEDLLDGLCDVVEKLYGILRKNNKPANVFSRNTNISRLQGAWINSFIGRRCGDILHDHEDYLLAHFKDHVQDLRTAICKNEMNVCTDEQLADGSEDQ